MKERRVEKLTPDMVGLETLCAGNWDTIEHVGKTYTMTENGLTYYTNVTHTIRDPKEKEKLPSERLRNCDEDLVNILDELWRRTEK